MTESVGRKLRGLTFGLTLACLGCNGSSVLVSTQPIPTGGAAAPGNGDSYGPAVALDGRRTAFTSFASNLVAGVTGNGLAQVYVYDDVTKTNTLVSRTSGGGVANGVSDEASISANGRYVVYTSNATNLVVGTGSALSRVYVFDLQTLSTTLASTSSAGVAANAASDSPSISADGSRVAFVSRASNLAGTPPQPNSQHVYVKNRSTGSIVAADVTTGGAIGNGSSITPAISADGKWVVFTTAANNLFPNDSNVATDVVKRSLVTSTSTVVSTCDGVLLPGDSHSPSISFDGSRVLFAATTHLFNICAAGVPPGLNRQGIFVADAGNSIPRYVGERPESTVSAPPRLSTDGAYVVFDTTDALVASDTNGVRDVYIARSDTIAARPGRASLAAVSTQLAQGASEPWLDGYGVFVSFSSTSDEPLGAGVSSPESQVFRRDVGSRPGLNLLLGEIADQGSFDSIFLQGNFRIFNGLDLPAAIGAGAELVITVQIIDPVTGLPASTLIETRPVVTCTGNQCGGGDDLHGGLSNVNFMLFDPLQAIWNFNYSFTVGDLPATIPTTSSTVRINACFHEAGFPGPDVCVTSRFGFVGAPDGIYYP